MIAKLYQILLQLQYYSHTTQPSKYLVSIWSYSGVRQKQHKKYLHCKIIHRRGNFHKYFLNMSVLIRWWNISDTPINTPHINELVKLLNLQCFTKEITQYEFHRWPCWPDCSAHHLTPGNEHGRNVRNLSEKITTVALQVTGRSGGGEGTPIMYHYHTRTQHNGGMMSSHSDLFMTNK